MFPLDGRSGEDEDEEDEDEGETEKGGGASNVLEEVSCSSEACEESTMGPERAWHAAASSTTTATATATARGMFGKKRRREEDVRVGK